jgi:hypothetical protein
LKMWPHGCPLAASVYSVPSTAPCDSLKLHMVLKGGWPLGKSISRYSCRSAQRDWNSFRTSSALASSVYRKSKVAGNNRSSLQSQLWSKVEAISKQFGGTLHMLGDARVREGRCS